MAVTNVKLAGREFVILPKSEYRELKARAKEGGANGKARRSRRRVNEDQADLAEIERLKRDPSEKPIPWIEARKRVA